MPERFGYESHLSRQAASFIISLSKRQQRVVLDLADQIAAHPFQIGDYRTKDAVGHDVENLSLDAYVFTYWVDHASREVRITEVIKV